jgi:hypothetical protein
LEALTDGSETGVSGEVAGGAVPRIHDVISAWRAADRELAGLVEDDPERDRVQSELVVLRAVHHRLFAARMAASPTIDESSVRSEFGVMAWGPEPLPAGVMA